MRFSLNKEFVVARREIPDTAMVLEFPHLPPSANNLYFNVPGKGRVKSVRYRDWIDSCTKVVRRQVTGRMGGRVDVTIRIEDCHPTRDADNIAKPCMDLLKTVGAIHDDRAKYVRSVKSEWAPIKGVEIIIVRVAA